MISWISTVGWSPFAVINPIWAYCKEYVEVPKRINLIYTQNDRIRNNLSLCKKYINEILNAYSKESFKGKFIFEHPIENEDIETYADKLKGIIEGEVKFKPKKVILDMTPGRKYMSAVNVYYGINQSKIPIQVFYLHLEESKYQNVPYPLTPIIKNELIDIIDSTEVFSKDSEVKFSSGDDREDVIENKLILTGKNNKFAKEFLILSALSRDITSMNQIRRFLYTKKVKIQGNELRQFLKKFEEKDLISSKKMSNKSSEYVGYTLNQKGTFRKKELKRLILDKEG